MRLLLSGRSPGAVMGGSELQAPSQMPTDSQDHGAGSASSRNQMKFSLLGFSAGSTFYFTSYIRFPKLEKEHCWLDFSSLTNPY